MGTASIGIETKLTCSGKVLPVDIHRHTANGEARAKGTYTVFHPHGLPVNYEVKWERKPSSNKCETYCSVEVRKVLGHITTFMPAPTDDYGWVKTDTVSRCGKK